MITKHVVKIRNEILVILEIGKYLILPTYVQHRKKMKMHRKKSKYKLAYCLPVSNSRSLFPADQS